MSGSAIDQRLLGPAARSAAADVDAAVRCARSAFEDRRWAGMAAAVRKKILQRFAEKIFAACDELAVVRFKEEAETIRLANNSAYGLQASAWSDKLSRAHRVARALRAGTVHVNQYDEDDITVPFGGVKQSGIGRDKSPHAFDKTTELKTTWVRIDPA